MISAFAIGDSMVVVHCHACGSRNNFGMREWEAMRAGYACECGQHGGTAATPSVAPKVAPRVAPVDPQKVRELTTPRSVAKV